MKLKQFLMLIYIKINYIFTTFVLTLCPFSHHVTLAGGVEGEVVQLARSTSPTA